MKQKIKYTVTMSGFEIKPYIVSGICSDESELVSAVKRVRHAKFFDSSKNSKFKKHLEDFSPTNEELLKIDSILTLKEKNLSIKTEVIEFDDTYENSLLVESFHTALRKYCDSKASWGLWQAINLIADSKNQIILEVFWSNLIHSWRMHAKIHSKIQTMENSSLEKVSKSIKEIHCEEMELDSRMIIIKKDDTQRPLWFILLGLYDSLPASEMNQLVYDLSSSKVK